LEALRERMVKEDKSAQLEGLLQEKAQVEQERNEMHAKVAESEEEIRKAKEEGQKLQKALEASQSSESAIMNELLQAKKDLEALRERMTKEDKSSQLESLIQEKTQIEQERSQVQARLAESEEEIRRAKEEGQKLQQALEASQSSEGAIMNELLQAKQDLEALREKLVKEDKSSQLEGLLQEKAQVEQERTQVQARLAEIEEEARRAKEEGQKLQQALEASQSSESAIMNELLQAKQDLEALKERMTKEDKSSQLESLIQEKSQIEQERALLQEKLAQNEQEVVARQQALELSQKNEGDLMTELLRLKQELTEAKAQPAAQDNSAELEALRKEKTRLEDDSKENEQVIEYYKNEAEKLYEQLADYATKEQKYLVQIRALQTSKK